MTEIKTPFDAVIAHAPRIYCRAFIYTAYIISHILCALFRVAGIDT